LLWELWKSRKEFNGKLLAQTINNSLVNMKDRKENNSLKKIMSRKTENERGSQKKKKINGP